MRWKSPPAAPAECLPANHGEPELAWESGGAGGGLQLEGRKSVEDALFALLFAQHPAGAHQLGKFGKQMSAIDDVSAALAAGEDRRSARSMRGRGRVPRALRSHGEFGGRGRARWEQKDIGVDLGVKLGGRIAEWNREGTSVPLTGWL